MRFLERYVKLVFSFAQRRESVIAAALMGACVLVLLSGVLRPTVTCVSGDMRLRYDARVPAELADSYLDAERMDIGFGAAALGGWEGLGDALAVDGRVFVRHTNRASPRYYNLAVNRYFQSNAFVYVPAQHAPSGYHRVSPGTRVDQLLDALARKFPDGVIAAGALHFAPLRTIAMSTPAIAGESVTQRAVRYYTRPTETVDEAWAYVVTLAAYDDRGRLDAVLPPLAVRTAAAGQALALRLRESPRAAELHSVRDSALAVGQLLKDAIVLEGELALYPVVHTGACGAGGAPTAPR